MAFDKHASPDTKQYHIQVEPVVSVHWPHSYKEKKKGGGGGGFFFFLWGVFFFPRT